MWWLELISVAMFAMGWWPCGGCDGGGGPGVNNQCFLYCAGTGSGTTPDEVTLTINAGATDDAGNCTDAQCDNMSGTYVLNHTSACHFSLSTGTMYYGDFDSNCKSGTGSVNVLLSKYLSHPTYGNDFVIRGYIVISDGLNLEQYSWENHYSTIPDCCGELTPATDLSDRYFESPYHECDMSSVDVAIGECT